MSVLAEDVVRDASIYLDLELEPLPDEVTTVFGQVISLVNAQGALSEQVNFEHVGSGNVPIVWGTRFHKHPLMEWVLRTWIIDRLQSRIDLYPLRDLCRSIRDLHFSPESDVETLEESLFQWLYEFAVEGLSNGKGHRVVGARLFYGWCVEEGVPGFDDLRLAQLESIHSRGHGRDDLVAMRDPYDGPLTRDELSRIEHALSVRPNLVRQKAMFLLARDWGLRAIQVALLRVEDFGYDQLGPYIDVPSAKGSRARYRRSPKHMVRRYINEDTAEALANQIAASEKSFSEGLVRIGKIFSETVDRSEIGRPIFPSHKSGDRVSKMMQDRELAAYVLHSDSTGLSCELSRLGRELSVPLHRNDSHNRGIVKLGFLRLRRTKGTSMYLSGGTLDEIAEALDHQSVTSVRHYARYNHDLLRMMSSAYAGSSEISSAVDVWSGKTTTLGEPPIGAERLVARLGKCSRGEACPYQPLVTCYSCGSFRPALDGDHESALQNMLQEQEQLRQTSSIPILLQTEAAIEGARRVLRAVAESQDR